MPRIGFRIPRELPAARFADLARQAEQAGLDEIWVVEDCFYAGGIATAATALAVTSSITVGIGVLPTVARNPSIAAMELAALAELHPGRLIAGFGHGVPSWMRQIGAYPASPLAALEETLTVVRRLFAGERVSMSGRHVHTEDVQLEFPPAIVPPIIAGVRGPKSLAVAGTHADGTILAEPAAPEYIRATRAVPTIAGRPEHQVIAYNWFALDSDPARARERARATLAATLGPDSEPHLRPLPFGADLLAALDDPAPRLRDEWVDHLTVSGTLDDCVAKVQRLHDAGTDSVVMLPLLGEPEEAAITAAARVAATLRP